MGNVNDARKALLATQLEHAVVNQEGDYYKVFVPGAVREWNTVSADNEDDAKSKVRTVLENKIDQLPEEESTGEVSIDAQNGSVNGGTTEPGVSNG